MQGKGIQPQCKKQHEAHSSRNFLSDFIENHVAPAIDASKMMTRLVYAGGA